MGTGNFHFINRCLVVTDEDFEDGNVPRLGKHYKDSLHSFPSRVLEDADFTFFDVVLTSGYYSGSCIDYIRKDGVMESILGYPHYFWTKESVFKEVNKFMGKISRYRFDKIVGKVGTMDINDFIEQAYEKLEEYFAELEESKVNEWLDELKKEHGYSDYAVSARFSNGETIYSKI